MAEGISKVVCLLSALTALSVLSLLARPVVPSLPFWTGVALAGGFIAGRWLRGQALAPWMALLYVTPGLFYAAFRTAYFPFLPWLAGALGGLLGSTDVRRWHLPTVWKMPLILWALTLALTGPVVALRELDFAPDLTLGLRLASNGVRTPHTVAVELALFFPLLYIVGFLGIDGLWAHFRDRPEAVFRRWCLLPLGVSFLLTVLIAAVQSFVDIRFLNRPRWIGLRAASGGLLDPNPLGLLAALAGPALLAAVGRVRSWTGRLGILAGLGAAVFGVLASGSRNALLLGLAALGWTTWVGSRPVRRVWVRWAGVGLVVVVGTVGLWGVTRLLSGTPLGRSLNRFWGGGEISNLSGFLWTQVFDRLPFYRVTGAMLREVPLTGVGSGMYYVLVSDYGLRYLGDPLHFDNAQNWYLHQLAELGILGSVGWIVWVVVWVRTVLLRPARPGAQFPAGVLKGLLVLFGLSSLVGAHAQDGAVLMTFWVLTFWAARLVDFPSGPDPAPSWRAWALVGGLALLSAGGQAYVSVHRLRPPLRAAAVGWGYAYGFYGPEQHPAVGSFRWTRRQAVTVLPVHEPRLRLRMFVHHPDVERRPVHIAVWVDDRRVLDVTLQNHQVHTWDIPLPTDRPRVALTVRVDRTWRPVDYGLPDVRTLGVGIAEWAFAKSTPLPGAH
jgi:hypothetical protein